MWQRIIFMMIIGGVSCDISDFFPSVAGNLTKITWYNGVINKNILSRALKSDAMMLESGVVLAKSTEDQSNDQRPMIGYPPNKTSDITLENFIETVESHNKRPENNNSTKAVYLTFRSSEAFSGALSILTQIKVKFPIFLSADILPGPVQPTVVPVEPNLFTASTKPLKNVTLALGWTTDYDDSKRNSSYTYKHITDMLRVLRDNSVNKPVTFSVRAGLAAESTEVLSVLVSNITGSTLTIWSNKNDPVNVTKLSGLISKIGISKIMINVPDELKERLDLSSSGRSLVNLVLIIIAVIMCLLHKS